MVYKTATCLTYVDLQCMLMNNF